LPNRVPCPLCAAIVGRITLEISSQALYSFAGAVGCEAESGKLVGGVNIALQGRSGVEILASRVFQFLHRSRDVEENNGGRRAEPESLPEDAQRGFILSLAEEGCPFIHK